MKVSRQFLQDFAYLANWYGWTAADIDDVKEATRLDPEGMREYWTTLAAAHRAGYKQTRENGYIRLHTWCALASPKFDLQKYLPVKNPGSNEFFR